MNKKIDLKLGRENIKLHEIPVKKISHKDFCTLKPNQNIKKSIEVIVKNKKSEGYLIDDKNELLNKFELHDLIV